MKPFLSLALFLQLTTLMPGADWPQLLGPGRDGAAAESEVAISKESPAEPKLLWEKELGTGHAGPVVAAGKVIIFHRQGDQAVVQALDATSGDESWTFHYPTEYVDSFGFDNGPRACPAVADGKVVVHGAEGMVHGLDLKTGHKLWSYDTVKEAQSGQGYFGRACSPLIVGKEVIITAGGSNGSGPAAIVSLGLADGRLLWQSADDEASYSSPIAHAAGGKEMLLCWLRNKLVVCDAQDGKITFAERLRSEMDASVNSAVPVFCGKDKVFLSACYGVGSSLWKWDDSGKLTQIWQKEESQALDSHYGTPVYYKGYLYGFHGRQEHGQTLRCIRVDDGQVAWESESLHGGTLLRVKDMLVVLTESGELWEIVATPDKFALLRTTQVLRAGHRSHAAYANGIWYGRDAKHIVAMRLTGS